MKKLKILRKIGFFSLILFFSSVLNIAGGKRHRIGSSFYNERARKIKKIAENQGNNVRNYQNSSGNPEGLRGNSYNNTVQQTHTNWPLNSNPGYQSFSQSYSSGYSSSSGNNFINTTNGSQQAPVYNPGNFQGNFSNNHMQAHAYEPFYGGYQSEDQINTNIGHQGFSYPNPGNWVNTSNCNQQAPVYERERINPRSWVNTNNSYQQAPVYESASFAVDQNICVIDPLLTSNPCKGIDQKSLSNKRINCSFLGVPYTICIYRDPGIRNDVFNFDVHDRVKKPLEKIQQNHKKNPNLLNKIEEHVMIDQNNFELCLDKPYYEIVNNCRYSAMNIMLHNYKDFDRCRLGIFHFFSPSIDNKMKNGEYVFAYESKRSKSHTLCIPGRMHYSYGNQTICLIGLFEYGFVNNNKNKNAKLLLLHRFFRPCYVYVKNEIVGKWIDCDSLNKIIDDSDMNLVPLFQQMMKDGIRAIKQKPKPRKNRKRV